MPRIRRRATSWLAALAALAAVVTAAPAEAQTDRRVLPFVTSTFPPPGFVPSSPAAMGVSAPYRLVFHKTARRLGCDHVGYEIRVRLDMDPGLLADGAFASSVAAARFDVRDALPNGLIVTRVDLGGDVLAASAGAARVAATAGPVSIPDIRFDPATFSPGRSSLSFTIDIDARIDRAVLTAPTVVDNQAVLEISNASGPYATIGSHDPALPEDADEFNGVPTSLPIDTTGCAGPASAQGAPSGVTRFGLARPDGAPATVGDVCFKLVEGDLLCSPTGNGTYVYRMPFGPEMSGRTVEFSPRTPGVFVDPPTAVVPNGGGVVEWTVHGARPGMTLQFSTIGHEVGSGAADGWGVCCTQLVEIVVPVADCPGRERPRLEVEKHAVPGRCDPGSGQCTFRITLTNRGDAPHVGDLSFTDGLTVGQARIAVPPAAPWQCSPATTPAVCRHPATTLAPGQSVSLDLTLDTPSSGPWARALNCARIDGRSPQSGRPRSRGDCAFGFTPPPKTPVDPPPPPRLKLEKRTLSPVCSANGECHFVIEVTNIGGQTHRGPVAFDDQPVPPNPSKIRIAPAARWICRVPKPGDLSCRSNADVVLPPKATVSMRVSVTIDPAQAAASAKAGVADVTNCAVLRDPGGGAGSRSCATAKLRVPKVDRPATPVPPPPVLPVPPRPVAPPPACVIPGQILNAAGRCVCDVGTTYDARTRSCRGRAGPVVVPRTPSAPTFVPKPPDPRVVPQKPGRDVVRPPAKPPKVEPVRPSRPQTEKPKRPVDTQRTRPSREQQRRPDVRKPQRERPNRGDPDAGRKILDGFVRGLVNGQPQRPRIQQEPLD